MVYELQNWMKCHTEGNSGVTDHPVILLGTVACSILIAVLACLPPVRRALAVDPALVLRGE